MQERKGDFSFGDWYYIHPDYSDHVRLKETYSFEQALELEEELEILAEKAKTC